MASIPISIYCECSDCGHELEGDFKIKNGVPVIELKPCESCLAEAMATGEGKGEEIGMALATGKFPD